MAGQRRERHREAKQVGRDQRGARGRIDHPLKGNYRDRRECHLEPDWLLTRPRPGGAQHELQRNCAT
ncbi:MAG: type II toxin-antitoxin system YafQ family toxin [Anaerolineae bacterium]|nr:type II toxin-antitoxin system YafQ family toxin [Anaerolineae bacterium]